MFVQKKELEGRKVVNVGRYGKLFYFELDGESLHPVLHFGMTGMLQVCLP
jgi:formamidopyrimidine-DNA glycosylase